MPTTGGKIKKKGGGGDEAHKFNSGNACSCKSEPRRTEQSYALPLRETGGFFPNCSNSGRGGGRSFGLALATSQYIRPCSGTHGPSSKEAKKKKKWSQKWHRGPVEGRERGPLRSRLRDFESSTE